MTVVKSNFTTAAQTANFFASLLPFGLGDSLKVKNQYTVATGDVMPADANAAYANNEYLDRVQNRSEKTKYGNDWTGYVSMTRGLAEDVVSSLYGAGGINNQLQDAGKSVNKNNENPNTVPELNLDVSGIGSLFGGSKKTTPKPTGEKPFNKAAFDQNQKIMERDLSMTGNLYNPAGTMQTSSQNGFTMLDPSKWTLNT